MGTSLRCPTDRPPPRGPRCWTEGDHLGYDALEIATCVAQRRLPARMRPGNIVARTLGDVLSLRAELPSRPNHI
jgi:hypothetical protein